MSQYVRRRLFSRVLLWDTKGGTILDLPTRYVLAGSTPSESEEYAQLASGNKTAIRRTNQVQIPLTAKELALMGEIIQRTSCPVKAAFIGGEHTDNWLWLEPTRLQVRDPEIAAGQQAQKVIELESNVFYPGIWEGSDVIAGVPWQGTKDWKNPDNGRVELRQEGNIRKGYQGPIWNIAASSATGRSVDLRGNTGDLSATEPAIIRIELPAWGAKIKLDAPAGYTINDAELSTYDFDGNKVNQDFIGTEAEFVIDKPSWYVELEIGDTDARPRLRILRGGGTDPKVWVGDYVPDCNRTTSPTFEPLPDPNEPPFWKPKEEVVFVPNNTAPTFEDRDDLEFSKESVDTSNNAPTFESRDNLEFAQESTVTAFEVGDTQKVYTHVEGLSSFDYPDGSSYNILSSDIAEGQIEQDTETDDIFVATTDGIFVYHTSSTEYILDTSGDLDKDIVGISLDRGTKTVYFTYNNTAGIYSIDYNGQYDVNTVTTNLTSDYWYLQVVPVDKEGYIFAVSTMTNTIQRFDIDGANKTKVIDGSNLTGDVYGEVKACLTLSRLIWEEETTTKKTLKASDYDGSNTVDVAVAQSDTTVPPFRFAVADKEEVAVTVSKVEGGFASVNYYAIAGGSTPSNINIDNADTGERVAIGYNYTISDNESPTFENRDNLEFTK